MVEKPISEATDVLAIYSDGSKIIDFTPELRFGMWADGDVVWQDSTSDTSSYFCGSGDDDALANVLARLDKSGLFELENLCRLGCGAPYETIVVRHAGKEFRMQSHHPFDELANGVATLHFGTTGLSNDENLYEVMSQQPASFLFYRYLWAEIETLTYQCIPRSNSRCNGRLAFKRGVVSWVRENDNGGDASSP